MNAMEELMLWELIGEDITEHGLPPGFRFHPTDEELVMFYLASKVFNAPFSGLDIVEVDLNRCEPWELPESAKMGDREWYFFSLRDRKYPTGLRTNRATGAGYWKATGKDREVHISSSGALVGMKKTLVFYKGRAPRGQKTKWVLHEYRLEGQFALSSCRQYSCKEEWVICRILQKSSSSSTKNNGGAEKMLLKSCFNMPDNATNNFMLNDYPAACSSSSTNNTSFAAANPSSLPSLTLPPFQFNDQLQLMHHQQHDDQNAVLGSGHDDEYFCSTQSFANNYNHPLQDQTACNPLLIAQQLINASQPSAHHKQQQHFHYYSSSKEHSNNHQVLFMNSQSAATLGDDQQNEYQTSTMIPSWCFESNFLYDTTSSLMAPLHDQLHTFLGPTARPNHSVVPLTS